MKRKKKHEIINIVQRENLHPDGKSNQRLPEHRVGLNSVPPYMRVWSGWGYFDNTQHLNFCLDHIKQLNLKKCTVTLNFMQM